MCAPLGYNDSFEDTPHVPLQIPPDLVQEHLTNILATVAFRRADRLSSLLPYLVQAAQTGADVTEDTIAINAFNKRADFVGLNDGSVRKAIVRLRVALREYYNSEGINEPLRLEIPKGTYNLTIRVVSSVSSGHGIRNGDATRYLTSLRDLTAWIDIRGLQVGSGRAHRFPIEDLYIPLTTMARSVQGQTQVSKPVRLEEAWHSHLVIVGDPGSGKTTFLRRIAYELCRGMLGEASAIVMPLPFTGFPILIRAAELEEHINRSVGRETAPNGKHAPAWLAHFLERRSQDYGWDLSRQFFEEKLGKQTTAVLLDGLDEVSGRIRREDMARLFENVTAAYQGCRYIVTTRPASYSERGTLAGYQEVRVSELEAEVVAGFLRRWSEFLFQQDKLGAERHTRELLGALRARVEIRQMARNPVMLTALAVVHWNERRLPEQRAHLYESILTWLARAREQRPGRAPAERCLELLGCLALGMQTEVRGRATITERGYAAEFLAPEFSEVPEPERIKSAQRFLDDEEIDSGIIISRGPEVRYWHLTFQEYLAARTIAGLVDTEQVKLLLDGDRLYRPEWREVFLLLAGTLLVRQGRAKVDALFRAVLDHLGEYASLAEQARCVGLLGAMLWDLRTLSYQPPDDRFQRILHSVLGIFDPQRGAEIELSTRVKAAEALGQAGDPRLRVDNWITIPEGRFWIGAQNEDAKKPNYDPSCGFRDGPVREVRIDAFQIGRYLVTVEEFRRFIEDDGYQNEQLWEDGGFGTRNEPDKWDEQLRYPNRPVVHVTWYEAAAYCAWVGGRLPTDAEWERAARGTVGRRHPWGDELPDPERANYEETKIGVVTPVGLFPLGATLEGVDDLAGNVAEWVTDWVADSSGWNEGRVTRGGSLFVSSRYLGTAYREARGPDYGDGDRGFRCVRELP